MGKKKGGCMGCLTTIMAIPVAIIAISFLEHPPTQKDIAGIFATATPTPSIPAALMLATLQLGYEPTPTDPMVLTFRNELTTLAKNCAHISRLTAADFVTTAFQELRKGGDTKDTYLSTVKAINKVYAEYGKPQPGSCPAVITYLVTGTLSSYH